MLNTLITLILALLMRGGISPGVWDGGPPDGLEATLVFLDQEPCTNMCENHGCIFDEHHIRIDGTQDANTNDPIELCHRPDDCDDHTGGCGVSKEEDLLAVAGPVAWMYLKQEYPQKVFLNSPRSAIQLLDCAGRVSAQFPVSDALLRDLARIEPKS